MSKTERDKGARWEREVARTLRAYYGDARRCLQPQGGRLHRIPDVRAGPWDIECKVGRRIRYTQAMDEATVKAARTLVEQWLLPKMGRDGAAETADV